MFYPVCAEPITPRSGHLLRRSNLHTILACTIAALAGTPVMAQSLTWDADPLMAAAQSGSGNWGSPLAWVPSTGGANQAWVSGADANFFGSGEISYFIEVGNVTVDDLSVTGGYTLQNGTITLAGGEGSHVITGGIISASLAGSEGVAIAQIVQFSGNNTYNGPTVLGAGVLSGVLDVHGGNAIPDTSTVTIGSGSRLRVHASETIGGLESSSPLGPTVEIDPNVILTIGANGTSTAFGGAIRGEGGLRKIGSGTFTLTQLGGFSSYSGDTIVDEGTLILGGGGPAMPAINPNSKVSIAAGATLRLNQISTIKGLAGAGKLEMGANQLTLDAATGTFSGEISGSGGISVAGSSNLTFSGANSFTGDLAIHGILSVPGVADTGVNSPIGAGGTIFLNSNGKLAITAPGSHSTNRTFQIGNGGTSGIVDVVDGGTLSLTGSILGGGILRKEGLGTLRLVGEQTVASQVRVDGGILAIANSSVARISALAGTGTVDLVEGTLAIFGVLTNPFTGVIQGPGSLAVEGVASLQAANTFSGGLTVKGLLTVGDFNLLGTPGPLGTGAVTIDGGTLLNSAPTDVTSARGFTVGPAGAKFGIVGSHTLTLTGLISGTGGVTGVAAATPDQNTLRLTNPANSFTGPLGVQNGSLWVEDIPASGVNSPIGAGNKIVLNNGTLRFMGVGDFSSNRVVELIENSSIFVGDSGTSLGVRTTGSGSLTKTGPGTLLQIDPTNDFTGSTVSVQEGVLVTGPLANSGIASGLGKGNTISLGTTVTSGELRLTDGAGGVTDRRITVGAAGGRVQISNGTVTLNGKFSGLGALTLSGNGAGTSTFVLNANHVDPVQIHSGPMVIESTTVRATASGSLGTFNSVVLTDNRGGVLQIDAPETIGSLQGGGGSNSGRLILNASLTTGNNNTDTTFDGVIEGAATLTKIGSGILTLTGANTFTGALVISSSKLAVSSADALGNSNSVKMVDSSLLRYTGTGLDSVDQSLSMESAATSRLEISDPNATLVWAGSVNGAAGAQFHKDGPGTLRLSGANGFSGSTNINAGKLQVLGSNALPNEGVVTVASGAVLEVLSGTNETIGALQGAGDLILGGQKLTLGGANASMTFSGVISGGGVSQLEKTGSGTLTLSNVNSSFAGGVVVADGAISVPSLANVGVNSPLGSNGPIVLGDSSHTGRLIITSANPGATNRPIVLTSGGAAVEVAHPAAEFELGGSITGSGSLLKLGAGKLKLSSPLGGPLVVAAGSLTLNTNISGSGGTATIIAPGILETPAGVPHGVGQLNLVSGTITPGGTEAIGMLTAEGVTFDSGTFDLDLQGTSSTQFDSLHLNGVATFNGPVELSIGLGFDPADWTDSFRIVVNDGNETVTLNGANGRFAYHGNLLEEGEHFLVTDGEISQYFYVEYGDAGDNDVQLFAAPEPGAATLLLTAGMCLFARRRRMADGVGGARS